MKILLDVLILLYNFRLKTMDKMNNLSQSLFRDADDLDQATRFLHENGKYMSMKSQLFKLFYFFTKLYIYIYSCLK